MLDEEHTPKLELNNRLCQLQLTGRGVADGW